MRKMFSLLALAMVLIILTAGFGIYWLSSNETNTAKKEAAAAEAKSIALGLSAHLTLLNKTLDKMAEDPDVLNAVNIGNSGLLRVNAARLEKYLPNALKIRLLLPDTNTIDEQDKPRMGFADLEMVKEALTHNPFPSIHGDKGVDRHLAITRSISQNGKVVGMILASLDENIILNGLKLIPTKNSYFELRQGLQVLAAIGTKNSTSSLDGNQQPIANSDWAIYYQYDDSMDMADLSLMLSIIIIPCLIALGLIFITHRWLSSTLSQDLESLMKAFKDIMAGSAHSHYPVELVEMHAAVSNLMQFKRVLDYSDRDSPPPSHKSDITVTDDNFDLDDLFDDFKF
ncbi:hypothetical protein [Methylovulum psychrotolerans]|jgi:phosphomannomutase/phosphoglucomutase|uniref:Double Cache domain-containing protein n=1 Tax=Methylovulum psychrotolerans TaxID=1704499 RepID=A0A1Z4BUG7_9GAMM|nr:hypothetical protein [Methylovulum psychrotolerans]ASF44947.1 hypothetical protein CEK71_02065 [Methylovulum psychrotolerans]MBT9098252.1 hypothetical protein [Methylovulum psychrotolerans]POZ53962.1 hypothetical protein AADEFJLK_01004 [Methylovulum psychrotolerans]